ncbi:15084_t:CDS:2, partial [Gigaspora rosea]
RLVTSLVGIVDFSDFMLSLKLLSLHWCDIVNFGSFVECHC